MRLEIPVKPISVNRAWRSGPRYRTKEYLQYENDICRLLPLGQYDMKCKEDVYVVYVFYLSNYSASDCSNFEKCLTDILVKRQYLNDDRYIKAAHIIKLRADKGNEKTEAYIVNDKHEFLEIIAALVQSF